MNKTVRNVLLAGIVLVQVGLLSNCGSSSSTEMSPPGVSVSVSSQSNSAVVGQTVQFTATVSGSSNTSVTWSVNGAAGGNSSVGTINSNGMYTAPALPPFRNTVAVQATSVADTAKTASLTLSILNPVPQLSSISPSAVGISGSAQATASNTVVTLSGTSFASQSAVTANGAPLGTTFVSATQLTATIPANLMASAGVLQLMVSTPPPGGGTTTSVPFTVLAFGQVSGTNNSQVAQYSITPPRDANVTIQFGPDTSYGLETWSQPTPTGGGPVSILVAGMKAFTTYHMRAAVNFPDGTQYVDSDQTFTTGGLPPERVPQVTVTRPSGLTPNGGVELLDLIGGNANQVVEAAVVDMDGNLIWYYDFDSSRGDIPFPIKPLPNGHMLINFGFGAITLFREIDLAGNTVRELSLNDLNQRVASAGFSLGITDVHHDILVLPNGHWVLLCETEKEFTDLPGFPGQTYVIGDALVDLDQNWNPVWVWSGFDHLDVNRHPFPPSFFPDWTHGNALIYSPRDGNLILSMRQQNWVLKIDYRNGLGSGDILWRLGPEGDFSLQGGGPIDWFYGQHYPVLLTSNVFGPFRLGLFDNGNYRVVDANGTICDDPGAPVCYSRAVIVDVNEAPRTARVDWEYKLPVFSVFGGSILVFENGNVEFDECAATFPAPSARVQEVTQQPDPQVVWELDIAQQFAYRAYRIPSLYPGVQW